MKIRLIYLSYIGIVTLTPTSCGKVDPIPEGENIDGDRGIGDFGDGGTMGEMDDGWLEDGTLVPGDAVFAVEVSLSAVIGSVAVVTWSAEISDIDDAVIEFGLDEDYGLRAPVDLGEPDYRTLLLGMKPSAEYHFRIVARKGNTRYESEDYMVETGPQANGIPPVSYDTRLPGEAMGGFTLACTFGMPENMGGDESSWIYIMDEDGDFVWWYRPRNGGADCVRVRMSYDGKYLYAANGNVPGPRNGTLVRVSMDGQEEKAFDVPMRHHDIAVLPDETVVYIEYESGIGVFGEAGTCDRIMSLDPMNGRTSEIYAVTDDFSFLADQRGCHSNAINFVPHENALSLSVLHFDALILVDLSGALRWTFGGPFSDYSGAVWNAQHQHHVLDDTILLLNNQGNAGGSSALEYRLLGTNAELVFEYSSGVSTQSMGGAARLPNGNTLVTYSNAGTIHEVNPAGELVEAITWTSGNGIGYTVRRESLYGPPPEYR